MLVERVVVLVLPVERAVVPVLLVERVAVLVLVLCVVLPVEAVLREG